MVCEDEFLCISVSKETFEEVFTGALVSKCVFWEPKFIHWSLSPKFIFSEIKYNAKTQSAFMYSPKFMFKSVDRCMYLTGPASEQCVFTIIVISLHMYRYGKEETNADGWDWS